MGGLTQEYRKWNNTIAEVMFPPLDEPAPVYLDLDEVAVEKLAEAMKLEPERVVPELRRTVRRTLDLSGNRSSVFGTYDSALWSYGLTNSQSLEAPPHLALLATFSLAAEEMGKDQDITNSTNYYGRLAKGYGLSSPREVEHLGQAYRTRAEGLWAELNCWLGRLDGLRGLPTARSVPPRFVGLAVSQALIRRHDRERLLTFFASRSFAPGAHVPPFALKAPLDEWLTSPNCNASQTLQHLWARSQNQDRLAELVARELANWDGRAADHRVLRDETNLGQRIRLTAQMGVIFNPTLTLSALVYASQASLEREAQLQTPNGPEGITLTPVIPGALQLGDPGQLDGESLVSGSLVVTDSLTGETLRRLPRRVVLFRRDELSERMIEADQTMLGDECWLLVKDEAVAKVRLILDAAARVGWREVPESVAPDGWRLFKDVQILSRPPVELVPQGVSDFSALIPTTTSQLSLTGGLILPGSKRNQWHVNAAPAISAVSDHPGGFVLELYEVSDSSEELVDEWHDHRAGALVVELADQKLAPGTYALRIRGEDGQALGARSIGLKNGDAIDQRQWDRTQPVAHDTSQPPAALQLETSLPTQTVSGSVAPDVDASPCLCAGSLDADPWWHSLKSPARSRAIIKAGVLDKGSCVWTGSHRVAVEQVPVDQRGRATVRWTRGECSTCGMVRRYPTNPKNAQKKDVGPTVRINDLSEVPPVREHDDAPWETIWDALGYTGGGSWGSFERLAMHIEQTPLAVDRVARSMQLLGHLDYVLDSETLRPTRWEVAPTALVPAGHRCFVAGYWPQELYGLAALIVERLGGRLNNEPNQDGPTTYFFEGIDAHALADELAVEGFDVAVSPGWEGLAAVLPRISDVIAGLPRRQIHAPAGKITRWDVDTVRWVDVAHLGAPGAYRVSRFHTEDYLRTAEDVERGTAAVSTVYFSKHAAAFLEGKRPYLAWSQQREALRVPKGCDLPGLYGRACVIASGRLPVLLSKSRQLAYTGVPEALAKHLAHLLSN